VLGIDRDVLDQHVALSDEENDEANNLAVVDSDEDVSFAEFLGIVVIHRGGTTADALDVDAVGALDNLAQHDDVWSLSSTYLHKAENVTPDAASSSAVE
jgi:hypothetical protein